MFQVDRFVEECRAALRESDGDHRAVREVLARAVSEPGAVIRALGAPSRAGLQKLHHAPDLTILNIVWAPMMTLLPHNHNHTWALIGIYTGREDNIFWRRVRGEEGADRIEAAGAKALADKEVATLGPEIIHSVTNPIPRLTAAIHVYGGDFFAPGRSEWDAETLTERPFDLERNMRLFEEANARWAAAA